MIINSSPAMAGVDINVRPEDLQLKENSWVRFTPSWPDNHAWVKRSQVFTVTQQLLVPVPYSYVLPESDYRKLDLSNANGGLKLYPADELVLYEILLGLKPGNFIIHVYVPSNRYIMSLADPTMTPDVSDSATPPTQRYIGALNPSDSPAVTPLWKLYAVKDMAAFQLWDYVLKGVDFEKTTIVFFVNKLRLAPLTAPTVEQQERATTIRYYEEMIGF